MCGISGIYAFNGIAPVAKVRAMQQCLRHRGPDSEGVYTDGGMSIAHNRLRIIDTSDLADQPMVSANGQWVMVYNGEVYNYKSLAAKYLPHMHFKSCSDSEVLLELFAKYGNTILPELSGMFAIAFYNTVRKTLFLIRDAWGKKPLYYSINNTQIAFASEIKALTQGAAIDPTVDPTQLESFFHLGFASEPNTLLKGIYKLKAGNVLQVFESGAYEVFTFKTQRSHEPSFSTEQATLSGLTSVLEQAVTNRLQSDVPWGALLSGGTDSSLVAAIAKQSAGQRFPVFSVGFEKSTFDETPYIEKVARHLDLEWHHQVCTGAQVADCLLELPNIYDIPFADTSAIPSLLVSQYAAKQVRMALTGDGGDELWLGYGTHTWGNRFSKIPTWLLQLASDGLSRSRRSRYQRVSQLLNQRGVNNMHTHLFSQEQYYFAERELPQLLVDAPNVSRSKSSHIITAHSQAQWEIEHYLKEDLLVKIDIAGMHYGLELRSPLLDDSLANYASRVPVSLKMRGSERKYLLKKILAKYLPPELVYRPKWGFSIPMVSLLRHDLLEYYHTYTSKSMLETYGYVSYPYVQKLKQEFENGADYLYNRIWLVMCLHIWLNNLQKPRN